MAAIDTKSLLLQVDASVELLRRNLSTGEGAVTQFERRVNTQVSSAERHFGRLGKAVDPAIERFNTLRAGAAVLGVGLAATAFVGAARNAFQFAAGLSEASAKIGLTVEQYQILSRAALAAGASQETLDGAMAKLNRTLGEAQAGSSAALKAFANIGISKEQVNSFQSAGDAIPYVMEGLKRLDSTQLQTAAGQKIMGRSVAELLPLLTQGAAGYDAAADAARRYGLLTQEQADRADEAADKMDALALALKTKLAIAVVDNIEPIMDLASSFVELVGALGDAANAWDRYVGRVAVNVGELKKLNPWMYATPGTAAANQQAIDRARDQAEGRGSPSAQLDRIRRAPIEGVQPSTRTRVSVGDSDFDLSDKGGGRRTGGRRGADEVSPAVVSAILKREFGGTITSTTGGKHVKGSLHYKGEAVDYVPRGGVGAISKDDIRRALLAEGIDVKQLLGPGDKDHDDHFHVGFNKGRLDETDVASRNAQAAEQAERARKEALDKQFRADDELAQLKIDQLRSQQELASGYIDQTAIAQQIVDAEQARYNAATDHRVAMGEISAELAADLKATKAIVFANEKRKLNVEQAAKQSAAYERLEQQDAASRIELLQLQADLATTAKERRAIELRILELAREEARRQAQKILEDPNASPDDKAAAHRAIALVDRRAPAEDQAARDRTRGPLEEYRNSIPDTAAEMNAALEAVAANRLKSLEDGLVDAITGAQSLGDVFKGVAKQILADLLRIAIQQTLVNGLLGAMGGGGGGLFGGGGGLLGNLARAFGGGIGGGTDPNIISYLGRKPAGRAAGGPVSAGRLCEVNEVGTELFVPNVNGTIVPNSKLRQGRGGGDGFGTGDLTIRVTSDNEMFQAEVIKISGGVVKAAAPRIVDAATQSTSRALRRPGIQ